MCEQVLELIGEDSNQLPLVVGQRIDGCWTVPETRMWREDEILLAIAKAKETKR